MKKLTKKKVSIFGKEISVFLIAMIAVFGFASAALVPYLSNAITGTVGIDHPLELNGTFTIPVEDAFEPIEQLFTLQNNAGINVPSIVEIEISGISDGEDINFSKDTVGEEFEMLMIGLGDLNESTCENAFLGGEWDSDTYCYWDASTDKAYSGVIDGNYYVQMGDDGSFVPMDGTLSGKLKMQFKLNVAPAIYTFDMQAVTIEDAKVL